MRRSLVKGSLDDKGFLPSGFKSSPVDAFLISQEAAFAPGNGMFSELGLTWSIPAEGTLLHVLQLHKLVILKVFWVHFLKKNLKIFLKGSI